jgi:hypothetical protein
MHTRWFLFVDCEWVEEQSGKHTMGTAVLSDLRWRSNNNARKTNHDTKILILGIEDFGNGKESSMNDP